MRYIICALFILSCFLNKSTIVCQECGKKHPTENLNTLYISGGHDARKGEFPWQVSLQYNDGSQYVHFCGGSLLNGEWILTAAHCFTEIFAKLKMKKSSHKLKSKEDTFSVVAGILDQSQTEETAQRINAFDYIIHEDFNASKGQNDVALVQVETSFTLNDFVEPICLPATAQGTSGTATITGWGAIQQGGPISDILQSVDLPVITDDECRQYYPGTIVESMICVRDGTSTGESAGPCSGDSGGPMVSLQNDQTYYLSGIVSWGNGCTDMYPAVLMEVSYFIDWINEHIGGS